MPVYTLACTQPLPVSARKAVADIITDVHCDVTGAPPEFVNVLFLHGQRTRNGERLAVIGNVRSGGNRNRELTDSLQAAIHDGVAQAAELPASQVSVRLIGFPASWSMEGGEILPEPGEEDAWLNRTS
ncbi:tautomerase family protein [Marinobacter sp. SS21]|uniref:tautomerase family protein n=1 Tax=Marinobacter sp. SS21 TaxID=2979460 RepID=UPI00232FCC7B|nr:hypothetical protein [Marinobacter sp. SS21]MDC0663680.1 hypothetical protein [Marinobacter sp. SS21]